MTLKFQMNESKLEFLNSDNCELYSIEKSLSLNSSPFLKLLSW